jgi:hypothetical protein
MGAFSAFVGGTFGQVNWQKPDLNPILGNPSFKKFK